MLPLASTAVQTTVLVPMLNDEPEGGTQLVEMVWQLSVAVAGKPMPALVSPAGIGTKKSGWHVMTGGSTSRTVTVNMHSLVPNSLVAVQMTTLVPTAKRYGEVMTALLRACLKNQEMGFRKNSPELKYLEPTR